MLEFENVLNYYDNETLLHMLDSRGEDTDGLSSRSRLIKTLTSSLQNINRQKEALEGCNHGEIIIMNLVKIFKGKCSLDELISQSLINKVQKPRPLLKKLLSQGLIFMVPGDGDTREYARYNFDVIKGTIIADNLLLETIKEMPVADKVLPLFFGEILSSLENDNFNLERDILSFINYCNQNNVKCLLSGFPGKAFWQKINKLLTNPDNLEKVAHFEQTAYQLFIFEILLNVKILKRSKPNITLSDKKEDFFKMRRAQRTQKIFEAWLEMDYFNEFHLLKDIKFEPIYSGERRSYYNIDSDVPYGHKVVSARKFLVSIIKNIGDQGWISEKNFIEAIGDIDTEFLISHRDTHSYLEQDVYKNIYFPEQNVSQTDGIPREGNWKKVEGQYVEKVVQVWKAMGIIDTAIGRDEDDQDVNCFKINALGKYVLGLDKEPSQELLFQPTGKPLVVQPNFEVLVFLDQCDIYTIFQLSRFADYRSGADKVLTFKIFSDSVLRSFQNGFHSDYIENFLKDYSRQSLPENLIFTIKKWDEKFGSIIIHSDWSMLEFPGNTTFISTEILEKYCQLQLSDNFWLTKNNLLPDLLEDAQFFKYKIFDYSKQMAPWIIVTPELKLEIVEENEHLFAKKMLAEICQHDENGNYWITNNMVQNLTQKDRPHFWLQNYLEEISGGSLPLEVQFALDCYGGEVGKIKVCRYILFTVKDENILDIIQQISPFSTFTITRSNKRSALLPASQLSSFIQLLQHYSLEVEFEE